MSKMSKAVAALGVVAGLGVAALPLSSYAAFDTAQVTAQVGGAISVSVEGNKATATDLPQDYTVADNEVFLNVINDGAIAQANATVTVSTSNQAGYTLSIKDSDNQTALVSGSDVISAGTPAKGVSAWGYSLDGGTNWKTISATETPIENPAELTEGKAANTVTFGVSASADQAEGLYKGGVIFTATAK